MKDRVGGQLANGAGRASMDQQHASEQAAAGCHFGGRCRGILPGPPGSNAKTWFG
jgi:hypothetical protein